MHKNSLFSSLTFVFLQKILGPILRLPETLLTFYTSGGWSQLHDIATWQKVCGVLEIYLKHIQTTFDISGQKVQLASSLEFSFDFIRECTLAAPAVKAL